MKYQLLVIVCSIFCVAIGMAGTVIPYFAKPTDRGYTGLQGFVDDYIGYTSYIKEGMYGLNTFRIRSLPPPQTSTATHASYVWMGKFGGLFSWSAPFTYHFFRAGLGFLLALAVWKLMTLLFSTKKTAFLAFIFACISSSVSWYRWENGQWIYTSLVSFGFINNDALRFASRPHYLLGASLFVIVTILLFSKKRSLLVYIGLIGITVLLGTIHPSFAILLIMINGIMILIRLWKVRRLKSVINEYTIVCVGAVLGVLMSYWSTHQYPVTSVLAFEQYVVYGSITTQQFIGDIIGFGPTLWIGVVGLILASTQRKREKDIYMLLWLIFQMLLFFVLYKYFRAERVRFIQSLYFVPFAYGTAYVFHRLAQKQFRPLSIIGLITLMGSMIPSIISGFQTNMFSVTNYSSYPYFAFPTRYMMDAYQWLDAHASKESVVVASYEAASNILLYSHNYVIGNPQGWPPGENVAMERERDRFLDGMNTIEAKAYVKKHNIRYIYDGYQEEGAFPSYPFLRRVYTNPEVTVYEIDL